MLCRSLFVDDNTAFSGNSRSVVPMKSSTPRKRSLSSSDHDKTLQNLRNKKVKANGTVEELEKELMSAIKNENYSRNSFLTAKGNITVRPVRNILSVGVCSKYTSAQ